MSKQNQNRKIDKGTKIVDDFVHGDKEYPEVQGNLQLLFKRIQAQAYAARKASLTALCGDRCGVAGNE